MGIHFYQTKHVFNNTMKLYNGVTAVLLLLLISTPLSYAGRRRKSKSNIDSDNYYERLGLSKSAKVIG